MSVCAPAKSRTTFNRFYRRKLTRNAKAAIEAGPVKQERQEWGWAGDGAPLGMPELPAPVTGSRRYAREARAEEIPEEIRSIRNMLAAVLERAIMDLQRYRDIASVPKFERVATSLSGKSAHNWIFRDYDAPFTFYQVCAVLELDPDAVRNALRRQRLGIFFPAPKNN